MQFFILSLFIIYFSQGVLYAKSSIISQTALALAILISAYYFIRYWFSGIKKDPFSKTWSLLLIVNLFGYIFTQDLSNPVYFSMFKGVLLSSLPLFPFYYFARKGILEIKYLKFFLIIMIPITILQYYTNENQILAERISTENIDVVNNTAYTFVGLTPFVFLFKDKKNIANVLMVIMMIFIIQSAKRGALIAGVIGLLIFIFYQIKTIKRENRLKGVFLVSVGLGIMIYYLNQFLENNEYLLSRLQSIEEGNSSGRNFLYTFLIDGWLEGNIIQLLFGFGFASSVKMAGNYAHNDWLELLSNFGLLGVTIYLALFYQGFKMAFSNNWGASKKIMLLCVMAIWLFITFLSMGYMSLNEGYLRAIILGCLIGSESKELE